MKKIEKLKSSDIDLSSHQRDWEECEQSNALIALNVLFISYNSEEIKLAHKWNYNKCKNQVLLLIINDEANNTHYFVVKSSLESNSLRWLRGKKEAIINNHNFFNYQTIKTIPERISKLNPYINKYNWKGIEFPVGPKDWIKFERNNKTIALNILFIKHSTEAISVAYRSEYNHKRKKQVILFMINDGKKQDYLPVTNLSALLSKKSSNHDGDFFYLNCFDLYTSKNELKEHEEICNNHNSCRIEMLKWTEKILKYNPG